MALNITTLPLVTVTSAGTPVAITSNKNLRVTTLIIEADTLNTKNIYYGDYSVSAATGNTIPPGESVSISLTGDIQATGPLNIGYIYIDSDTSGNKARCSYY